MSKASEALDVLRAAGLKVSVDREPAEQEPEPEFVNEEDVYGPSNIHYIHEEHPVRSIKVLEMNFGNIKLELDGVDQTEEAVESMIHVLVRAIRMLHDEAYEIRMRDCPF